MWQVKKIKFHKSFVFLLSVLIFVNFSFCLAPFVASARSQVSFEESYSEVSQNENKIDEPESCEDPSSGFPENESGNQETKTEQEDNAKNTVPSCCLDHDKNTEIDNALNLRISDLRFPAVSTNSYLEDDGAKSQNSLYIHSLDLPPLEADILFSVFKKE